MSLEARAYCRPVLCHVNGIGDNLLALPALRGLTALWGKGVTLVCGPEDQTGGLYSELNVDRFVRVRLERSSDGTAMFNAARLVDQIGRGDLFVSLCPWVSPDMVTLVTGLRCTSSVGFFPCFTKHVELDFEHHATDVMFRITRVMDPQSRVSDHLGAPRFTRETQREVEAVRQGLGVAGPYLVVHGDSVREKMWPVDKLIRCVRSFVRMSPHFSAVIVGRPSDKEYIDAWRGAGDRIMVAFDLPLAVSHCLVAEAALFLGIDSCHLHFADFGRVPSVGLFGDRAFIGAYGILLAPHITIHAPTGMSSIDEGRVLSALLELSARGGAVSRLNGVSGMVRV